MKVIFLDVDGVLNCIGTKDRIQHPTLPIRIRGLDAFRVKMVSDLAIEMGAKVVISSTWRESYEQDDLVALLRKYGFEAEVIGYTPKSYETAAWGIGPIRGERGDDIQQWLNMNGPVESFLVLDDLDTQFKDNQVQTKDSTGFFAGNLKRARRILSTPVVSREDEALV